MGLKPLLSVPWGSLKLKLGCWMKHLHPWLAKAQRAALALCHAKVPSHPAEGEWASRENG